MVNTGILSNASPLSSDAVKSVEHDVLQTHVTTAYLDENNKLCFALPCDVETIKDLAWNNAYQLSSEASTLTKLAYRKTGPDSYELDGTFTKASENDTWGVVDPEQETQGYATFSDGVTLTWDELQLAENGTKYSYNTDMITDDSVGEKAFQANRNLVCISIPDSVTTIERYAFTSCMYLTDVTVGNGVTTIGEYAFTGTIALASLKLGKSLTSIGNRAFSGFGNNLTNLIIPDNVVTIEEYAFENLSSLLSLTIGESVGRIDRYAFAECTSLEEINFNATSLTYFQPSNYVFNNAGQGGKGITVNIGANVTQVTPRLCCPGTSQDGHKPANVIAVNFAENSICHTIGDGAFEGCELTHITIPRSVTTIGYAFYNCTKLTSIEFEGTVEEWNNISLDSEWNYNVPATEVVCIDGRCQL